MWTTGSGGFELETKTPVTEIISLGRQLVASKKDPAVRPTPEPGPHWETWWTSKSSWFKKSRTPVFINSNFGLGGGLAETLATIYKGEHFSSSKQNCKSSIPGGAPQWLHSILCIENCATVLLISLANWVHLSDNQSHCVWVWMSQTDMPFTWPIKPS